MTHYAIQMYDFHCWATQTMINRLRELPPEVYKQPMQSVFPSISHVMAHIYMVDSTWFDIFAGQSMREASSLNLLEQQALEAMSLEELEARYQSLFPKVKTALREAPDLELTITLDNPYASIRETKLAELILQVVNHGTYHRGNITAMLRQLGHPSVMTEYALFWYAAPVVGG